MSFKQLPPTHPTLPLFPSIVLTLYFHQCLFTCHNYVDHMVQVFLPLASFLLLNALFRFMHFMAV